MKIENANRKENNFKHFQFRNLKRDKKKNLNKQKYFVFEERTSNDLKNYLNKKRFYNKIFCFVSDV